MIEVSLANLPDDYAEISRVTRLEWEGFSGPEELAYEDAALPNGFYLARFVARRDGTVVGVGEVGHDEMAHREGKLKLDLRVPPDLQGTGIGKALYDAICAHIAHMRPHELHTDVWAANLRPVRFMQDRGFVETHRRTNWALDVTRFDAAHFASLDARATELGIEIKSLTQLSHDSQRHQKLHALDAALWQDVPLGEPVPPRTLEDFVQQELQHPQFLPEACFIAVKDDVFVGYISHRNEGDLNVEMTGVLPALRGRGLATLLKLHGIRYAQVHGYARMSAVNDSENEAMLHLNAKLGFTVEGQMIRFVKLF
jgi:GNAT superfamily N-acetyltransferase